MTGPLSLTLPPALAELLVEQLPLLADEVLAAIAREVPAYARPLEGAFGAGVRRGVQFALTRFLALAGEAPVGDSDRAARGREVYAALGRDEARVGRSLDALLAAYRTGARVAWARLAELGLQAGLSSRDLVELAAAVFAYIDELSAASAEGFTDEQSMLAGDRDRRRNALALLLISDTAPWPLEPAPRQLESAAPRQLESVAPWQLESAASWQLEEAARVAGWRPPATLTAVLVPVRAGRDLAARWDDRALVAAEDDAAGTTLLLLPDLDGPGQRDRLDRMLSGVGPAMVGLPQPWTAVRRSVALVRRAAGTAGVTHLEDHLASLVVTADPLALAELTARRLAPFAALTPRTRDRLLDTLRCWLAHDGDRQAVAVELGIHPQTVRYRVGQLRELLGADLGGPLRRFELALVLHARAPTPGSRGAHQDPGAASIAPDHG